MILNAVFGNQFLFKISYLDARCMCAVAGRQYCLLAMASNPINIVLKDNCGWGGGSTKVFFVVIENIKYIMVRFLQNNVQYVLKYV